MKRLIGMLAALCAFTSAQATVGEQHRVATQPSAAVRDVRHRTELRITIWYPATPDAPTTTIDVPPDQPLFRLGQVAMDAPFADAARHPVVLLSHGFGGAARVMAWFGTALAERGYVVIAVDHPGNNGVDPMTREGAVLWWERAADLRLALTTVLADSALAPHVDAGRIGVAGFSIGGLTALAAGGARIDPPHMIAFCRTHPSDGTCRPQLELKLTLAESEAVWNDPALAAERARSGADYTLPNVRSVFAMAPVVQGLSPASLRAMRVPVAIVVGRKDITVPADTQAAVAKALIPRATLTVIPEVNHYSFLGTCSEHGRAVLPVCRDAAAQADAHRIAIEQALVLFDRTLAVPKGRR